jgi:O-antigen ligase
VRSPVHWAFGTFIAIAIVSVLLRGEILIRMGDFSLAFRELALLISYGVFFALTASIIRPREVPKMITAILVMASITAFCVILEYRFEINPFHEVIGPLFPGYVSPPEIGGVDSIGRRLIYGPTVQPLAVAVMMSLALPFALAWLLKAKERRERILYTLMVVLLFAGALATQKKTSLVGPVVCVIVLIFYRPKQMARLAPLAVLLIGVAHVAAPGALGSVVDQLSPNSVDKVNTTKDRVSDYQAIEPDFAAHPLIGSGYGSYNQKEHRILDNQYLDLAIGVGLVGILAYLAVFATAFINAHRVARSGDPRRGPPALGAAAAIIVALVTSAVLDFLSFPQLPYLLCFIAAIAYVLGREHLERRMP